MKKRNIFIIMLIFFLAIISGCNKKNVNIDKLSLEDKVKYQMDKMSLEEKIAQMLIVYYNAPKFDNNLKKILESVQPGGFILQGVNITTFEDTFNYVESIKKTSKIPMFISIDQEGGIVQRLNYLKDIKPTNIPPMSFIGELNNKEIAYKVGDIMAKELRTIGVNLVYAPVLDINIHDENTVIGSRSFGKTKEMVMDMSLPLAKGIYDNKIIPVFKHFPGHGNTVTDSHIDLPIDNKTLEELKELELIPFKEAIKNDAKMIMVGHIAHPNITGDNTPASLSKKMITDVLRKDLAYDGIVITDALNMGALTQNYSDSSIYEMAINAGVDILLMPNGSEKTIALIMKSINEGKISESRVDESVRRILTLKYQEFNDYENLNKEYLGRKEHIDFINEIRERKTK